MTEPNQKNVEEKSQNKKSQNKSKGQSAGPVESVGSVGIRGTVVVGKANDRRVIAGKEKSVGRLGADPSKVTVPTDGAAEKTPSRKEGAAFEKRPSKPSVGQLGVFGTAVSSQKFAKSEKSDKTEKFAKSEKSDKIKNFEKPESDKTKNFEKSKKSDDSEKFGKTKKKDFEAESFVKSESKKNDADKKINHFFERRRKVAKSKASSFLPMSLEEARQKGWDELDIILVSGDAYVDHSGFGTAVIGRVLEKAGFRVGIIAQPDWTSKDAFEILGKPRLFFSVSAGNADSLVNNYTPLLYRRENDLYSPGGVSGLRPDRAVIAYSNRIRQAYPDSVIIAGGIEASLRRFAEFDYLSNTVRQSVLADAPIDLIVYGMGELQITEIAKRLDGGESIHDIRDISGTVWKMPIKEWKESKERFLDSDYIEVPSFEDVFNHKEQYANAFRIIYENQNPVTGKSIIQPHPKTVIVQNPPMRGLTEAEMDDVYELPYLRLEHPSYTEPVPGLDVVRFSITSHRGCFGGCSFCAIAQHQGRAISNRSEASVLREARLISEMEDFNGIINGLGGPSANMYGMTCPSWEKKGACTHKNCLVPSVCPSLRADHSRLLSLLKQLRELPNVRKVLTGYGVRFDLALLDTDYLETLCAYHVGGQLKVAPEHFCDSVTKIMRKPDRATFEKFESAFREINKKLGMEQYLVAFQISGHPGCTLEDAVEMAEYIRDNNHHTEQVQDFTPTPMTISTCMFHTGLDPFTMEKIYVPVTRTEKKMQRVLLQYQNSDNKKTVQQALERAGRSDLIGNRPNCLISKDWQGFGKQ